MKRIAVIVLATVLMLFLLAMSVSANAPPASEFGEEIYHPLDIALLVLIILVYIAIPIALTCTSEWFIMTFFGLGRENNKLVIRTNLLTQGLMWSAVVAALFINPIVTINALGFCYAGALLVLELPIYVAEYFIYRKKMKNVSLKTCLLYTLTANTVSLLLGLAYNSLF